LQGKFWATRPNHAEAEDLFELAAVIHFNVDRHHSTLGSIDTSPYTRETEQQNVEESADLVCEPEGDNWEDAKELETVREQMHVCACNEQRNRTNHFAAPQTQGMTFVYLCRRWQLDTRAKPQKTSKTQTTRGKRQPGSNRLT
jgi:hypothetical protein